jgi:hypothetical protein
MGSRLIIKEEKMGFKRQCHHCDGKGTVRIGSKCPVCGGSGKVSGGYLLKKDTGFSGGYDSREQYKKGPFKGIVKLVGIGVFIYLILSFFGFFQ